MHNRTAAFTSLALTALVLAACASRNLVPAAARGADGQNAPAIAHAAGSTTLAWGTLVDDPSGRPLPRESVKLIPWQECRYSGPIDEPTTKTFCPAPVAKTVTRTNGRFELRAPDGRYLLVIGSDSPSDFTRPTIHDDVVLSGGLQHLVAPTVEPFLAGVKGFPKQPSVELHGDYRLMTLTTQDDVPANLRRSYPDGTSSEVACLQTIDHERAVPTKVASGNGHSWHWTKGGWAPVIADEWLMEDARFWVAFGTQDVPARELPPGASAWGNMTSDRSGGDITNGRKYFAGMLPPCAKDNFAGVADARTWYQHGVNTGGRMGWTGDVTTLWFGAHMALKHHPKPQHSLIGKLDTWVSNSEFDLAIDPRTGFVDPNNGRYWWSRCFGAAGCVFPKG